MITERPSWDDYFLGIAHATARRGDCSRRQVGAIIVDDDHRIVSTGYNGAPPGRPGCLTDGACPRGQHTYDYTSVDPYTDVEYDVCRCGGDWPCKDAVPPGSSYDTGPGACISLHAEQNAILYAGRDGCIGNTMYITDEPCGGCQRLIDGSGLRLVVWPTGARVIR